MSAREVATKGLTVSTVCPGSTDTPALCALANNSGQDAAKVIGGMTRSVPMRGLGTPDDVGAVVAIFACDAASYVTGQPFGQRRTHDVLALVDQKGVLDQGHDIGCRGVCESHEGAGA